MATPSDTGLRLLDELKALYETDRVSGVVWELEREAVQLDPAIAAGALLTLFEALADIVVMSEAQTKKEAAERKYISDYAPHAYPLSRIVVELLGRSLPLEESDFEFLLDQSLRHSLVTTKATPHVEALVRTMRRRWKKLKAFPGVYQRLESLADRVQSDGSAEESEFALKLSQMLNRTGSLPIDTGEAWSDVAIADVREMNDPERSAWVGALMHARDAKSAKPSAKWMKAAMSLLDAIGYDAFKARLIRWLPLVDHPRTAPTRGVYRDAQTAAQMILDHHAALLRGLCWMVSTRDDPEVARALGSLALSCYRKIPGVGPRATKLGNAAVYSLGVMPGRTGIGQLALLRIKVKFGTAQKLIESAFDTAAQREGMPRDEVEEMAVPEYGLTSVGRGEEALGEYRAVISVEGTSGAAAAKLSWINPKGKPVKSAPAAIKNDFPDELKDLKAAAKDIQKMLPAQRDRIDSLFLQRKTWPIATWRERYLDHPLTGTLARRIIWLFEDKGTSVAACWLRDDPKGPAHADGKLVRVDGSPFDPEPGATVSLWHPISADAQPGDTQTRADVLEWRAFLEEHHVSQPFKQAHREVYLLTDAERNTEVYSNRFAAHVIRQHQFHALAAQRGWKNRLRLLVDDEYPPAMRPLEPWGLRAEFWIEGIGDDFDYVLESGAFQYLATDQVRFYSEAARHNFAHAGGGEYAMDGQDEPQNRPVRVDQVPPLVLSEVLRDVDLFVGVGSIGNNPEWVDGGPEGAFRERFRNYWQDYSFGELSGTAKTRKEFLERLVPRLAIADACTVTDKFLIVAGTKRTYKIHLGSGNILMEPNDQYLCIVPAASWHAGPKGQKLFLPFEGDRTLAIVLSKAFMLAEDDKITDKTILSQIRRR